MKLHTRQKGLALIELSISLMLMISIAFGITEFGRAMYQYNTLAKAARDAARYLSARSPDDALAKASAKCLVMYGSTACTGTVMVPGLTEEMVTIQDAVSHPDTHAAQGANPVLNLVTVTIGGADTPYIFRSLVSFVTPDIEFAAISVTMKQVL